MKEILRNNAASTLAAAITSTTATTLTVASAAAFPTTGNFRVLVDNEIMLVTGVSGTTFTVTRGAEGTTAATHGSAAAITHILTSGSMQAYGRQNDPYFELVQYSLQDGAGGTLTSSSFTVVNGSDATITDLASGPISVVKNVGTAAESVTFLARTTPATPYTVTAAFDFMLPDNTGFSNLGLGFRESATGKIETMSLGMNGGSYGPSLAVYRWLAPNNNTTPAVGRFLHHQSGRFWARVSNDGTNLTFYVSHNGIDWIQIWSETLTTFFTTAPDQVGFYINSVDATTYKTAITCVHWDGA